jgi:hypothetical protein
VLQVDNESLLNQQVHAKQRYNHIKKKKKKVVKRCVITLREIRMVVGCGPDTETGMRYSAPTDGWRGPAGTVTGTGAGAAGIGVCAARG